MRSKKTPAAQHGGEKPVPSAEPDNERERGARVHVVIADQGWILERCARELERRLDYVTVGPEPDPAAGLNYYVNYSAYREPQPGLEMAFFTHIEERAPEAAQRFFDVARSVDHCVCMSAPYAGALRQAGVEKVQTIVPGVDLEAFRPVVRIGVVGRTYHTGRKGEALVAEVMDEPGIEWHFTGEGWPGPGRMYAPEQMPDFYNSVDYILVPAYYEGGPMSLLEALACGKEVIAPPVGFVADYPHIEYAAGDAADLRRVLRELVARRMARRESVAHRSWEAWAAQHDALFREILALPAAAASPGRSQRLRVLLTTHFPESIAPGGPSIRVNKMKEHLERLGLAVDVSQDEQPAVRPGDYDLVHVFNVWEPGSALAHLRHLRQACGGNVPIVLSPIYLDLSETAWAVRAIPSAFNQAQSPRELQRYVAGITSGNLLVDGIDRTGRNEITPGYFAQLREIVGLADHLIALSDFEMERLWAAGVSPRPFSLVRNAAGGAAPFAAGAAGDLFAAEYGVRDYVLCVGRIEPRKNQLMLVHALRATGLPLVLIGRPSDPDYANLVRRYAGPNVHFIEHLPHDSELLAAAYAGARVFALPSWSEGAPLSALEAAAAGTALVLSDRSSEREYFGDLALYCDPGDPHSIRKTVEKAFEAHPEDDARRQARQALLHTDYTWENAAAATVEAYHDALARFQPRPVETAAVPSGPRKLEIGSGLNPQPGYEHLDVRPDLPHLEHVHDINQPLPFDEGTFDEILSRSCLEHVSWREIKRILTDWRRVLKPGGKVKIWMPDFEYLCRMYLNGQADEHLDGDYVAIAEDLLGGFTPATWALIKMFAGQDYPANFHAAVYDFDSFARLLESAGFERVERRPPYHGLHVMAHRPLSDALPANGTAAAAARNGTGSGPGPVKIRWGESIFTFSGYSRLSRQTVLALDRQGVEVGIEPFAQHEQFMAQLQQRPHELETWQRLLERRIEQGVYVCFHPPVLWNGTDVFSECRRRNPGLEAYVGLTMFETDRLPPGWAAACNAMDEVWVPSTFNRETFVRAGVDASRLQVIPFGLDTVAYDPDRVEPLPIPDRRGFTFLSVFQWNRRKGWDVLLPAYLSAFAPEDDVCLVLRTYPDRIKAPPIRQRLDAYVRQLGYDPARIPPIILLDDFVPEDQMPALYAAADAFVLPTRGEGWGIPFMEAMAMGLPAIATRWSAHLDFMNDDNSYLIDVDYQVPVDPEQMAENPFYTLDQRWAEPSPDHTAHLMRHVFDHREEARAQGARARREIEERWTVERTATWVVDRAAWLTASAARRGRRRRPGAATPAPRPQEAPAPSVLWEAPIYDPSGYADEARNFILNLRAQGVDVAARAIGRHSPTFRAQVEPQLQQELDRALAHQPRPGFINLIHFPAYAFQRSPLAAYNIGRVMFETDGLPPDWVARCNQMDEIWVPTDFNLETFRRAGVKTTLFKVPGGIDAERFRPGRQPLAIPGAQGTVFLSIFEWSYRKGWDALLRAWAKAFFPGDDVSLILRTYPLNVTDVPGHRQAQWIEQRIDRFLEEELGLARDAVAPIVVLGEQVPEQDLPGLFTAAGAYVGPSRGEGWGRPYMQAMACGLPVIATRWSGNLEFMNDDNSLLVDVDGLQEIDERAEVPFHRGQLWAEPSVDRLVTLLRWVYDQPEAAALVGQRARRDMVERWSWERATAIAAERLQAIEAELARRRARSATAATRAEPVTVRWEGSQFVTHSLALVNRELCLRLAQDREIDLSIVPYEPHEFGAEADPRFEQIAANLNRPLSRPAEVHVRHQWPPDFNPPAEGHWVIIQPWEFGSLPRRWVDVMRTQVDEVWVPSHFVRQSYVGSGVPADRVHVVPNGVNTGRFRPAAPPLPLQTKKRFKFLFVGGTIGRKGIDVLLESYANAFTDADDVCLVIKDMGGSSFYRGQTARETIAGLQGAAGAPEIEYIDRTLTDDELAGLYTACDCLVHPYRGEGFGLPIAEAMASGLPVIVTGYGAALDFCNEQNAYLIPAEEVFLPERRIGDLETVGQPWWAEPDRAVLAQLMRHVVDHPDEARAKGQAGRAYAAANLTWERAAGAVRRRLEALCGQPIRRHLSGALARVQAAQAAGDWLQAIDLLKGLLEESGDGAASLWNRLGYSYFMAGQAGSAESAFQQGLALEPDNPDLLGNLADLCLHEEKFEEATGYLNRALQINPDDVNTLISLGNCAVQLGAFDVALVAFRRVQTLAPGTDGVSEIVAELETLEKAAA